MAIAELSNQLRIYIEKEMNYEHEQFENKVSQIKDWIKKQPHLPQVSERISDKLIRCFLVGSKLSNEKIKRKLEIYYTERNHIPELFQGMDPRSQEIRNSVDIVPYFPLAELTPQGIRVNIGIIGGDQENKVTAKHLTGTLKRVLAICTARHQQGEFWTGEYIVIDSQGFYRSHITEFPWPLIIKFFSYMQGAHPLRVKGVFIINCSSYMEVGVNMVKPILSEKIRNRIHIFHGDHTNLYEFIPKRILPKDYGGDGPSIGESNRAWQKTIESMADLLIEDEKYTTDESKRPIDCASHHALIYGMQGTFNKLNID